jgi:hypothetical protein
LYIHAIARKCGICQKNTMPKSTIAGNVTSPVAAAHPITGGSAPGTAPTIVASDVRVLSGVYTST